MTLPKPSLLTARKPTNDISLSLSPSLVLPDPSRVRVPTRTRSGILTPFGRTRAGPGTDRNPERFRTRHWNGDVPAPVRWRTVHRYGRVPSRGRLAFQMAVSNLAKGLSQHFIAFQTL